MRQRDAFRSLFYGFLGGGRIIGLAGLRFFFPCSNQRQLERRLFRILLTGLVLGGIFFSLLIGGSKSSFGQEFFIKPREQSSQQVSMQTANSLNYQWKKSIVEGWNRAFEGRYPFINSDSEVSLTLLAQYLRPDDGRIDRFLKRNLGDVLHKEGSNWVPNNVNAKGVTFNPAFLEAINTLSHLVDVAFSNDEINLHFDLRPEAVKNVIQTNLIIDNQRRTSFNEIPAWTRFNWPVNTSEPGATLSWTTAQAGTQLYADVPGVWGVIRLLDKAQISSYSDKHNSYTLRWKTSGGLPLIYILQTEVNEGPLVFLKLKGFVLPEEMFLTGQGPKDEP
ncbi:type VI secretion IcmF C-terminal domain-containing protein [Yersinia intermedia]|uniref:type VI secretion IcmF C-terminal domain-containing protein n=1 Tax=Yersinia intermedia TaxID=631 RepID=UPI0005E19EB2|nr:type VI secretion IcmF C-terminal domain-containing protein [Yersinia intermedia]CND47662.1 ImcF domain-containing protein [Yersinia intermedia]